MTSGKKFDIICAMKNKTNIVGIRMDDKTLERLDSLLISKTRSATIRLLLMYVDKEVGKLGAHSDFVKWVKKIDNSTLASFLGGI